MCFQASQFCFHNLLCSSRLSSQFSLSTLPSAPKKSTLSISWNAVCCMVAWRLVLRWSFAPDYEQSSSPHCTHTTSSVVPPSLVVWGGAKPPRPPSQGGWLPPNNPPLTYGASLLVCLSSRRLCLCGGQAPRNPHALSLDKLGRAFSSCSVRTVPCPHVPRFFVPQNLGTCVLFSVVH